MSRELRVHFFTKPWRRKRDEDGQRPRTATLDHPVILDPRFMHQIDMSLIRNDFLSITNLCRVPLQPLLGKTSSRRKDTDAEINNNVNVNVTGISNKRLPEPCTTCGRPDQPERFHSHPLVAASLKVKAAPSPPTKSSVQKPVAIRYTSTLEKKGTLERAARVVKVPVTLTCYICGREFGTTSLPLHEPKCLEKWHRENEKLPSNLRKSQPSKPDMAMTREERNKLAWKSAQAQLIPCENCHRTFLPDRLEVHQRSCKEPQRGPNKSATAGRSLKALSGLVACAHCAKMFGSKSIKIHEQQCLKKQESTKEEAARSVSPGKSTQKPPPPPPPMFPCYLCGRLFTVTSIYIHEPQCLKKWQVENDKLPPEQRRPVPAKPEIKFTPTGDVDCVSTFHRIWENHLNELVVCAKCGRTFFPNRISTHRRVCKGNIKK